MRRRDLLALLVAATARPGAVFAADPITIVGYLSALSEAQVRPQLDAFRRGLAGNGFAEGQNVSIEYRWAEGNYDRLPVFAAELVRQPVSLILAPAPPAALAAKAATTRIPIVFVVGFDPVAAALVESINKPGGNATGMTMISSVLGQKRLELVHDLTPGAKSIAVLVNPISPDTPIEVQSVEAGAKALGVRVTLFNASTPAEIEAAFDAIAEQRPDVVLIGTD